MGEFEDEEEVGGDDDGDDGGDGYSPGKAEDQHRDVKRCLRLGVVEIQSV